jgi:hypothetical protein
MVRGLREGIVEVARVVDLVSTHIIGSFHKFGVREFGGQTKVLVL